MNYRFVLLAGVLAGCGGGTQSAPSTVAATTTTATTAAHYSLETKDAILRCVDAAGPNLGLKVLLEDRRSRAATALLDTALDECRDAQRWIEIDNFEVLHDPIADLLVTLAANKFWVGDPRFDHQLLQSACDDFAQLAADAIKDFNFD